MARARQEWGDPNERAVTFAKRARASADLAQTIAIPNEPGEAPVEATACELFRQSAYWSLCALSARSGVAPSASYDAAVWDSLDRAVLVQAATEDRSEVVRDLLCNGSFVQFAELASPEQVTACEDLRKLAQELLRKVDRRDELVGAIYQERLIRLGALGVFAVVLAVGAHQVSAALEKRRDLAFNHPWRASSRYGKEGGCSSPAQDCAEASGFFFHTNEEASPWVEFDLGDEKSFARVDVTNRTSCCSDRAVPLTVEISSNHGTWRSVAQRDTEFSHWTATFKPVTARWVRLRLLSRNYLHLSRVEIH